MKIYKDKYSHSKIDVLDHGYILLLDIMGSDEFIVETARVSTNKGFLGWGPRCETCGHTFDGKIGRCDSSLCSGSVSKPGDEKLLRYLYENKHSTPFEFASAIVEVQAPIFVFREWHRHRTQSYSEMSARYTPLPDLNYVPTAERLLKGRDYKNKQNAPISSVEAVSQVDAETFRTELTEHYAQTQVLYESALNFGTPKELARLMLPVGRYSRMRAVANLRNWLAFLTLREATNAQWEIRQYANALHILLKTKFPRTFELFEEEQERADNTFR